MHYLLQRKEQGAGELDLVKSFKKREMERDRIIDPKSKHVIKEAQRRYKAASGQVIWLTLG